MLDRIEQNLVWYDDVVKKSLPKMSGKTVTFSRFKNMGYGKLLSEGTTPSSSVLSAENVSASIIQEGDYVVTTDLVEATAIAPVVKNAIDVMKYAASKTVDRTIGRFMLWRRASTSATLAKELSTIGKLSASQMAAKILRNGSGAMSLLALSGIHASSVLTVDLCAQAKDWLEGKDCPTFPDGTYHGITDPAAVNALSRTSAWLDLTKYVTDKNVLTGEAGKCQNIRFKKSTHAPRATKSGATTSAYGGGKVYMTFVYGPNAYGITHIENLQGNTKGAEIILTRAGEQSTEDPLRQRPTKIGYKVTHAPKLLNTSACLWIFTGMGASTVTI